MIEFLQGALSACSAVAGLFFLRFWFDSKDRLFLWFAIAFLIMAGNRFLLMILEHATAEEKTWLVAIRLIAFLLIVAAIIDKNRPQKGT